MYTPERFAGHTGKVFCGGRDIADRLRVLGAAANDLGDDKYLIKGVRVDMRRLLTVLGLERADEVLDHLALVGRIELDDTDVAESCLARLLLKTERQPDRAELDRLPSPALRDAGLSEAEARAAEAGRC